MRRVIPIVTLVVAACLSLGASRGQEVVFSIDIPMDDKPDTKMGHVAIEYVVHKSGFAYDVRNVFGWAHQASRRRDLTQAQLTQATNIVASLPDSAVTLPKDKTVIVTRHTAEGKKRTVYDRLSLPPEMKELFDLLGGLRFELKDRIRFNLEQTDGETPSKEPPKSAGIDHSSDESPLNISIRIERPEFEVNQRTDHTLVIKNQSSQAATLPSFRFLNIKQEDAEIAFYLKEQILRMQLMRGTDTVPLKEDWLVPQEKSGQYPTVDLQPGETILVPFSLTRHWYPSFYSLTTPDEYTLTVTLDTTGVSNSKILKGKFTSQSAKFRISPVGTFREKKPDESQHDYAKVKVAFYFRRIAKHDGEYFTNVWNILQTKECVPALLEALDSQDDESVRLARSLLGQIHHHEGRSGSSALPISKTEWMEWWQREEQEPTPKTLWSNFDSHYQ